MKKITIFLILCIWSIQVLFSQKVDSIKVEQSGDFIKIRYKILDSKPDQIFRVTVLCSINAGLNTEIESISGDAGDHIVGGKPEYWVVWDVLKDVEQLKSAEFIVRAELINNVAPGSSSVKGVNTSAWDKKWANILPTVYAPGPKVGLRLGIIGSFGISWQLLFGKTVYKKIEQPIAIGFVVEDYVPAKQWTIGIDLTKRIVNKNGFQMHILAGIERTRITFQDVNASITTWHEEKVFGPELGFVFGIKNLAISLTATNFDPGQVEKGTDLSVASPTTFLSTGIGLRF